MVYLKYYCMKHTQLLKGIGMRIESMKIKYRPNRKVVFFQGSEHITNYMMGIYQLLLKKKINYLKKQQGHKFL